MIFSAKFPDLLKKSTTVFFVICSEENYACKGEKRNKFYFPVEVNVLEKVHITPSKFGICPNNPTN
jgi:hypothetical protein